MSGESKAVTRLADGVIARIVQGFVKDAERLEARAAEREAERLAERAATRGADDAGAKLSKTFKQSYAERFFQAHPELRGKVWVHHALERQIEKRYPGVFTDAELHELSNLRGIPKEVNRDLHLSNIRRLWNGFYKNFPHANADQIRAFRDLVDNRYGSFFNPPLT